MSKITPAARQLKRKLRNNHNKLFIGDTLASSAGSQTKRVSSWLQRTICSLLLVVVLSTSVFAVPATGQTLMFSYLRFEQDARIFWLTNASVATVTDFFSFDLIRNPILAFFGGGKSSGARKQQRVARISVSPNAATIREGESLFLNGIAYDSENNIVQGVPFKWTAIEEKQKSPALPLPNGKFEPQFYGDFLVVGEAGGLRAQIKVKVVRDDVLVYGKELEERKKWEAAGSEAQNLAKQGKIQTRFRPTKIDKSRALPQVMEVSSRDTMETARRRTAQMREINAQLPAPDGKSVVGLKVRCTPENPNYPDCGAVEVNETKPPAGETVPKQENVFRTVKYSAGEKTADPESQADAYCPTDYVSLDGEITSDPSTAVLGNRLFVFARGTDNTIYWKYTEDGYNFSNYIGLGGISLSAPAAVVVNGRLYVEVTGTDNQRHIRSTIDGGNNWTNWGHGTVNAQVVSTTTFLGRSYTFVQGSGPQPLCVDIGEGGCAEVPYSPTAGWNSTNYPTADDPGQQTGNPPTQGMNAAGSGNFSFSAPVISLGGRGDLSVNLSLNYNSLLWHKAGTEITYDIDKSSPAPGWNIGFGKMVDMGGTGGAMLETADGTRHPYEQAIQSYYNGYSNITGRTTDGSFIDYTAMRGASGIVYGYSHLPNGIYTYYSASSDGVAYPTYIKDRHGNYINITYCNNVGPKINTITDNLNRTVQFNYDAQSRLISINGPGFNNTTQTLVQLHYRSLPLTGTFSGLTANVRTSTPEVIDAIYYPATGTGYWFGDNNSYSDYGMIAKVMLQRGMTWSGAPGTQGTITQGSNTRWQVYDYPLTAVSTLTEAPKYTSMTEYWYDPNSGKPNPAPQSAPTQYSMVNDPANVGDPRTLTVTMPNGSTVTQFSKNDPQAADDGMLYKTEVRAPGTNELLSRTEMEWALGHYSTWRVTQIKTTDEVGQQTKQVYTYDSLHNQVASVEEYGYETSAIQRKTVTTYENGQYWRGNYTPNGYWSYGEHIFGLVKSQTVYGSIDGVSTALPRLNLTEYNYDQNNLIDAPNVVMYDQQYNPYNSNTVQGGCINYEFQPYDPNYPEYGGNYYCTEYEQVPDFFSYTLARGNATQTTVYENATPATPTGAITYESTYDITGNVRTTTTNCCQQMSFDYTKNTEYSQPESYTKGSSTVSSPDRMTKSATYDFNTGLTKTATDFNNRATLFFYDTANRPTETRLPTLGRTLTQYDDANLKVTTTTLNYTNTGLVTATKSIVRMNGRGQQVTGESWNGATWNAVETKYNEMGGIWQKSMPFSPPSNASQWTTYAYDQSLRPIKVTAPDGSISQTVYNDAQRPSSATPATMAKGRTVFSRDAWGRERWARNDAFGRTVEVVEPDPIGTGQVMASGNMQTNYVYNGLDQLVRINQGSQMRAFRYDSLGRLKLQKLAEKTATINDAGVYVGAGNGNWSDAFQYDFRSNLVQSTDARGVKTDFSYQTNAGVDPLNRLHSISYDKSGAFNSTSISDAAPVTITYAGNGDKTRVTGVATGTQDNRVAVEEKIYDDDGRVIEYKMTLPLPMSKSFVTNYFYDSLSRVTKVVYPEAYGTAGSLRKEVTQAYDEGSRLAELRVDNQIQMSEIFYNPMSQVTALKTGAATGNADIETYGYNAQTGLLIGQEVKKANTSQPLLELAYGYQREDQNGNPLSGVTGQLTKIVNLLDQNKNRAYEFDTLGRLKMAKAGLLAGGAKVGNNPTVVANWMQTYSYDRYGNRTGVTATGITAATGSNNNVPVDGLPSLDYEPTSNRINTTNYEYDLAGNLTKGQDPTGAWQRYEYDAAGRLIYIRNDTTGAYLQANAYTSSRLRLWSSSNYSAISNAVYDKTYYIWNGSALIAEYTANTASSSAIAWVKSYIYAGSRLLSTFTNTGSGETLEFHHPDRLGTKLVTNNTANTYFEQNTLPFGTPIQDEDIGLSTTKQKFTTYDRSDSAKLDYAVNRSYSSGQSRFTTVDPIGMSSTSIGNPQSMNLYAYVENNPIDFVDPTGLDFYFTPPERVDPDWWRGLYDLWLHSLPEIRIEPIISNPGIEPEPLVQGGDNSDDTTDCIANVLKKYPNAPAVSEEEWKNFLIDANAADRNFKVALERAAEAGGYSIFYGFYDGVVTAVVTAGVLATAFGVWGAINGAEEAGPPGAAVGAGLGAVVGLIVGGIVGISHAAVDEPRAQRYAREDLMSAYNDIKKKYPSAVRHNNYIRARNGDVMLCQLNFLRRRNIISF